MSERDEQVDILEFDYVVLGAGASAMGFLYGILSPLKNKPPPFSIVVLERGTGPPHAAATISPHQWCDASHRQSHSVSLLESYIGSRVIDVPVGKGLGGSTNVHACLCTAPAPSDFSTWPEPWDETLLCSIAKVQEEMIKNKALYVHSVDDTPYESCTTGDSQSQLEPHHEAVFPSLVTHIPLSATRKKDGSFVRRNYYEALVEPLLQAYPHLADSVIFIGDFEVQRLLFSDNDTVVGVEGGSQMQVILARREVILCAGAIESPALLLISGIGHHDDLRRMGISPRQESSAGVGRGLRDHVLVPRVFLSRWTPQTLSPNGVHALCYESHGNKRFQFILNDAAVYSQLVPHFMASFVRRRFTRPPVLSSLLNIVCNFLFVSLRLLLKALVSFTPAYFVLRYNVVTMNIALLNPKSTGTVTIQPRNSSNAEQPLRHKDVDIQVDAGYLRDSEDVQALWDGWKTSTRRFDSFLSRCLELFPGVLFRGFAWSHRGDSAAPNWFRRFVSHFCLPYFHWCGTCAMRTDGNAEWVVDSHFLVRNFRGIRVCDASVFPSTISGPTALTCAGVGYACASQVLITYTTKKVQ